MSGKKKDIAGLMHGMRDMIGGLQRAVETADRACRVVTTIDATATGKPDPQLLGLAAAVATMLRREETASKRNPERLVRIRRLREAWLDALEDFRRDER